jgi:hypothetical protein
VTLPKISTPMTAAMLRARVLEQLASMNGRAPKENAK